MPSTPGDAAPFARFVGAWPKVQIPVHQNASNSTNSGCLFIKIIHSKQLFERIETYFTATAGKIMRKILAFAAQRSITVSCGTSYEQLV